MREPIEDGRPDGAALHALVTKLYPIARSITGPGVRESLALLRELAPVELRGVPSGTRVLDWEVPAEWHLRDAFIENPQGERVVDAARHNLHVVNFSTGVEATLSREALEPHLHSLPEQPDAIPYRTNYYGDGWGFCMTHRVRESLGEGPFRVRIDAERRAGELNFGELLVPGETDEEILVSTHVCHPSLANDNLSGMVLAAALAAERLRTPSRYTWRFVFVPGTIGAISWLASRGANLPDVRAALVLTGLGDESAFTWKRSPQGDAWIDRVAMRVLAERHPTHHADIPFGPYGYDERQYGSPGYRLPVGRLTRGVHGTFPEYHTSLDDLSFVTPAGLAQALDLLIALGRALDADRRYENLSPFGEPQLGRRGLYGAVGAQRDPGAAQMAMLWMLNQSDGTQSLVDIATRSGIGIDVLADTARLLVEHELLCDVGAPAA